MGVCAGLDSAANSEVRMEVKPMILALLAGLAFSGVARATLFDRGSGLIDKATLDAAVHFESVVAGFSRYHKQTLDI